MALAFVVLSAASCVSLPPKMEESGSANAARAVSQPLVLRIGDEIDIRFRYWPELDESQIIRPDGMISLQLVQDVQAAGLTPVQLREQLLSLYEAKLRDPEIAVIIRSLANQRIYVGGEVNSPGLIPLQGDVTLLEAIITAGGFDKTSAQIRNVVLIRLEEGKRRAWTVDLRTALREPESSPVYLRPNDVVFVPRTPIDRLDQWVDQYLSQTIPSELIYAIDTIDELSRRDDEAEAGGSLENAADFLLTNPQTGGAAR